MNQWTKPKKASVIQYGKEDVIINVIVMFACVFILGAIVGITIYNS